MNATTEEKEGTPLLSVPDLIKDNVPSFFVNGFHTGFTMADAHIIFLSHNQPNVIVNFGLPALKTLHDHIGQLLNTYEKVTGEKAKSMEQLIGQIESRKNNL